MSNTSYSRRVPTFQLLNLPTEIIDDVAGRLGHKDFPSFALTCKRLYEIGIGRCYESVLVASTRLDTISLPLQGSSMRRMKRLMSDPRKRNGVRELKIQSIGVRSVPIDAPDRVIPEPFLTEFRKERIEWNERQPAFIKTAHDLFFGNYEFPRLKTLYFDSRGLATETDTHHFLSFLKRHPGLQNVIVEGHREASSKMFAFQERAPCTVDLRQLQRVAIFGPFLPLLLGFRFVPSSGDHEYEPLEMTDTIRGGVVLPLTRVHISWPQRTVHVCHVGGPVNLDLMHVLRALASVCKDTLRVLQIDIAGPGLDVEAIEFVTEHFSELRELNVCPVEEFFLTDQAVLMWMAEALGKLKHLERFMYSIPNASDIGYYSALGNYVQNPGSWDAIAAHFAHHCPSLKFLTMCSLVWKRVVRRRASRLRMQNEGFELIMTM